MTDGKDISNVLQGRFQRLDRETAGSSGLKGGDGNGTSDGMEARVKTLEGSVGRIESKLDGLVKDVAEIKGRIANMPSTWQMIGMMGGLMALVIGSVGGVLGLIRFLKP